MNDTVFFSVKDGNRYRLVESVAYEDCRRYVGPDAIIKSLFDVTPDELRAAQSDENLRERIFYCQSMPYKEATCKQRFAYFIQAGKGPIKIGVAADPFKRLSELQTGNADRLRIIAIVEGSEIHERALHGRFADHRLEGEWFRPEPVLAAIKDVLLGIDQ